MDTSIYTDIEIILCIVGIMIAVGCLIYVISKMRSKKTGSHKVKFSNPETTMTTHPVSPAPVVEKRKSYVELARTIHSIYRYSTYEDRAKRNVWVCKACETENSMMNHECLLCGHAEERNKGTTASGKWSF